MADNLNQSHAFIGKGKIYMTPVKDGVKQSAFWVGVASAMAFSHSVDGKQELFENHSGNNQLWDVSEGTKKTSVSLTIQERRDDAMRAALQATVETVAAATVTGESHNVGEIGDMTFLKHGNVSDVAITDAADGPLVEGTDYTVDADYGRVELLTGGHTAPLAIDYGYGESKVTKPMTDDVDYYEVRLDGINTVGQQGRQITTAYRVKLDPADTYDLINENFAEMSIEGECLFDEDAGATYQVVNL